MTRFSNLRGRAKPLCFACFLLMFLLLRMSANRASAASATVTLIPFRDPMPGASPRLWNAGDRQFNAFVDGTQSFSYENANVAVTYEKNPATAYFSGTITATGLKPHFWYQMKLLGKPKYGSRGWGSAGDDWANEQIGLAGRWWGDEASRQWNIDSDSEYQTSYAGPTDPAQKKTVYGYIYMAGFLTDENGAYSGPIKGNRSCHVTWQDWQNQTYNNNALALDSTYLFSNSGTGYGYKFDSASTAATNPVPIHNPVKLWYEYEARPGRIRPNTEKLADGTYAVKLPAGTYNCRFLLTEESFHNYFGSTSNENGGFWLSVLASEDFGSSGQPDSDTANDVVFTIGATDSIAPQSVVVTWPQAGGAIKWLSAIRVVPQDNVGGSGIGAVNVYLSRKNSSGAYEYWAQRGGVWSWSTQAGWMPAVQASGIWVVSNAASGAQMPAGASLADGTYTVFARAFDKAGNSRIGSLAHAFQVDTIAPTSVVTQPASGFIATTLAAIKISATDNSAGIARVNVYLRRQTASGIYQYWGLRNGIWNWGVAAILRAAPGNGTWNVTTGLPAGANLAAGTYYIFADAYDKAGNSRRSVIRSFSIRKP